MQKPKIFIFLHGYNANGDAMKILDETFKKIAPKNSIFLYPDAPFKANGGEGYCWFQFVFGEDPFSINEEYIFHSMNLSLPYIKKYVEKQLELHPIFNYNDIIFVGFSQGAGLSLHSSIFLEKPVCGAISFSGGLANPNNEIISEKANKSPILLIHGNEDQILPYQFSQRGYNMLKRADFDVEYHLLKNTKHIITPEGIKIAEKFVQRICK